VLTTFASYQLITRDLTRSLDTTANKPLVARESAYYLDNIENVKSIDDFLGDDRLFGYAMKAFGLGDMSYAKAFMRKVLTEGIDNDKAFANSLSDPRYKAFAEAFNFARYGATTTVFDRTRQGTVDNYVRQTLEEDAGQDNEGVRLALYFSRKAPGVTSAYGLMADAALLKVTQTALGIPSAVTASMDIEKQADLITSKLDVADLKDPAKLKTFLNRFASLWELDNPTSNPASPAVLFAQPVEAGVGGDLLATLQNLRLGGS
jgi:hypothetical protein